MQPPVLPEGAHILYSDAHRGDIVEDKYGQRHRVDSSMHGAGGDVYLHGFREGSPDSPHPHTLAIGRGSSDRWYGIRKVGAEDAEPASAPTPQSEPTKTSETPAPWITWKKGEAVTFSGNGGIEQSGKLAADASGKVYEDHGPEHGGIQIRVRRGPKVRLVPADQIRSVAGKQIAAPAPAENSPAPETSTEEKPLDDQTRSEIYQAVIEDLAQRTHDMRGIMENQGPRWRPAADDTQLKHLQSAIAAAEEIREKITPPGNSSLGTALHARLQEAYQARDEAASPAPAPSIPPKAPTKGEQPGTAENSPAPAENSTVAVPRAFLESAVFESYSADKITDKGSTVRKPFAWDGSRWVSISRHGRDAAEAYRLVPRSEFPGKTATYSGRSESQKDKARGSAEGFYHGLQVSERGKPMVMVGPPVRFVAGEAPAPPEAPAPAAKQPLKNAFMVEGKPFQIGKLHYAIAVVNHHGDLLGQAHMFSSGARSDQIAARNDDGTWRKSGAWIGQQWADEHGPELEREYQKVAAQVEPAAAPGIPPKAPTKGDIPAVVRTRVKIAVDALHKIADSLMHAREADRQFGDEGRYEWETWESISDRDKHIADSQATLATFRKHAIEKGIDPEALIHELGGIPDYEPSAKARAWGGQKSPAPSPEAPAPASESPAPTSQSSDSELTDPEKKFIDAAAERLQSGAGFKDNTDLARFAAGIFGGNRHAGKWNIKQVYDLLEGAVAKYIDSHRWPSMGARRATPARPPAEALAQVRALMAKLPRQVDRTAGQEAFQQFSTPPTIALLAAVAAHFEATDTALEPSAGTAMLAGWAKAAGVAHIETNEIDPHRRAILRYLGYTPSAHDAEQLHNLSDLKPTVVIMNPPFSAAGNRGITKDQTVAQRHVEQALHMLAEGGRLVAILPGGRTGMPTEGAALDGGWSGWWEKIAAAYNVRANVLLPGKEYSKYGTTYPTRLVVIDKTGATPGGKSAILNTDAKDLDDALQIAGQIGSDRPEPAAPTEGILRPGSGEKPAPAPRPGAPGRSGTGAVSGEVEPGESGPASEAHSGTAAGARSEDVGQDSGSGQPSALPGDVGALPDLDPDILGDINAGLDELLGAPPASAPAPAPAPKFFRKVVRDPILGTFRVVMVPVPPPPPPAPEPEPEPAPAPPKKGGSKGTKGRKGKGPAPKNKPATALDAAADAAAARLDAYLQGTTLNMGVAGLDPALVRDFAITGARFILQGALKFRDWSAHMLDRFGPVLRAVATKAGELVSNVLRGLHQYAAAAARRHGADPEATPAMLEHAPVKYERNPLATQQADVPGGTYTTYVPAKLTGGAPHPAPIVQSAPLAAVEPPDITYRTHLPEAIVRDGRVSNVQLEAISYTGHRTAGPSLLALDRWRAARPGPVRGP
jgi:hypothetical protein